MTLRWSEARTQRRDLYGVVGGTGHSPAPETHRLVPVSHTQDKQTWEAPPTEAPVSPALTSAARGARRQVTHPASDSLVLSTKYTHSFFLMFLGTQELRFSC